MDDDVSHLFESVPLANWNGEIMPLTEVRVSVLDRAFLFGDAVYEVIRLIQGKPFLFDDHLDRLQRNIDKLRIPADVDVIRQRIAGTIDQFGKKDAIVYIQVTRGVAPRMHRYPVPDPEPNILIYVADFVDPYADVREQGASVLTTRDIRWQRCDIKSVNLLANCMVAQQAHEGGCTEALLLRESGQLVEGSRSSLFGVKGGVVLTAPLSDNVLPGITRRLLMRICSACNLEMREEAIFIDQIHEIDELFLTSTSMGILPVTRVDGQLINDGQTGSVTRQLLEGLRKIELQFTQTGGRQSLG